MNKHYFNILFAIILIIFLILGFIFVKHEFVFKKNENTDMISFLHGEKTISPIKKRYQEKINPELSAALVSFIGKDEKNFFMQYPNTSRPMASITKLMTAIIIIDSYDLVDKITIDDEIIKTEGDPKKLIPGETYTVNNLLHIMLVESNNEAAEAFAKKMGRIQFIEKMNQKASELKMINTKYLNPTGLDVSGSENTNMTSPEDIKKIIVHITQQYPLIAEILSKPEYYIYNEAGNQRNSKNTNILLLEDRDFLWGKTGFTDKAKGCLVIISRPPNFSFFEKNYIINVIMGAKDRFKEAKDFKTWTTNQFIW